MLKPVQDKVIVKVKKDEEKTSGGIYLPDTAQQKQQKGKVIAVGEGKLLDNGKKVVPEVKKGDAVIFSKYGGTEVKYKGEEYLILDSNDVLAVVEE